MRLNLEAILIDQNSWMILNLLSSIQELEAILIYMNADKVLHEPNYSIIHFPRAIQLWNSPENIANYLSNSHAITL